MTPTKSKLNLLFTLILLVSMLAGIVAVPANTAAAASGPVQSFIVQGKNIDQVAALVLRYGGSITSRLAIINGVAATLPVDAVAALKAEAGITQVTSNATAELTDYEYLGSAKGKDNPATDYPDVVGADRVWEQGVTGQGVTVAILDTGIANNPHLLKDVNGKKRNVVGWADFIENKKKPTDPNGHGTHIAGIIANAGKGEDGEYNGVAPGVDLVSVRVLDETGTGTYESVIQGIQWVIEHKAEYNIKVLNMSIHALVQSPYWADPLNQAVMRAWAEGITVVVAAGNGGPGPMTISVPGNIPYVITVGAFTDHYTPDNWADDYIAPFSASGPTLDNFVKPDVVAPGAHMVSTMMPNSYIARNHEANRVESNYFSMAGTSQAAAVVSGVAALAVSKTPALVPDQVKYRIMATSLAWITEDETQALYSIWQQGMGRVNAPDAVLLDLNGSANQGMDIWGDLNGTNNHYEGYSYFDAETGEFRLRGHEETTPYSGTIGAWSGAIGAWSGAIGAWSGSNYGAWGDTIGAWSGTIGAWSGTIGAWSGAIGAWSGAIGAWSGTIGAWSGAIGAWSGGYATWVDAIGAWSGAIGAWSGAIGAWSGGIGAWSGGVGAWSGGIGAWSGGVGAWSGGIGAWSGGIGAWSGGIGAWSGGVGAWSGGVGAWSGNVTVDQWIEEPKP